MLESASGQSNLSNLSGLNLRQDQLGKLIEDGGNMSVDLKSVRGLAGSISNKRNDEGDVLGKRKKLDDISDIIEELVKKDKSMLGVKSTNGRMVNKLEVDGNFRDIGVVFDEVGVLSKTKDQLSEIMKAAALPEDNTFVEVLAKEKVRTFKSRLRERLASMGVDKYKKSVLKAGKFIKSIYTDYYYSTRKRLKFGLGVEHDKEGDSKHIVLEANDFIDSVDLNKVVVRVNSNEETNQTEKIDPSEYLEVVEMDAQNAMERLKKKRTSLTPDVSRWFGAVQRIVGMPKEGEPFRNYLQRAMSMKREIDDNLNNPEQENIENALQEIVPILYDAIFVARNNEQQVGNRNVSGDKIDAIDEMSSVQNNRNEEKSSDLTLGEETILAIEKATGGYIDVNDYNTVSKLDAEQAMVVLKRIAEHTGKTEMARLISQSIQTDNENIEGKTFSEYVDSNLDYLQSLQKNIRRDLEELDMNLDIDNVSVSDIFKFLAKNKDKLKYTESSLMAQLFRMGGIAAPTKNETLSVYFDRLENNKTTELRYFLKYAVPNLRRAMNKNVYNKLVP